MLPSDTNLEIKTGTVRYNNKILVSDGKFSLGQNVEVNSLVLEEPVISMPKVTSHKAIAQQTPRTTGWGTSTSGVPPGPHAHELANKPTLRTTRKGASTSRVPLGSHEEEKIAFILFLAGGFAI